MRQSFEGNLPDISEGLEGFQLSYQTYESAMSHNVNGLYLRFCLIILFYSFSSNGMLTLCSFSCIKEINFQLVFIAFKILWSARIQKIDMQIFKVPIPWFANLFHWKSSICKQGVTSKESKSGHAGRPTDRHFTCALTNNWGVPYSSLPQRHN